LLRKICDIQPVSRQNVALSERIGFGAEVRIESLGNVEAQRPFDIIQARIALSMGQRLDLAFDIENPIDAPHFEMHARAFRKVDAFERLERHLVVDDQKLAASGQQAPNIDLVRLTHNIAEGTHRRAAPFKTSTL
jgi:hypothetical protein